MKDVTKKPNCGNVSLYKLVKLLLSSLANVFEPKSFPLMHKRMSQTCLIMYQVRNKTP